MSVLMPPPLLLGLKMTPGMRLGDLFGISSPPQRASKRASSVELRAGAIRFVIMFNSMAPETYVRLIKYYRPAINIVQLCHGSSCVLLLFTMSFLSTKNRHCEIDVRRQASIALGQLKCDLDYGSY